MDNWRMVNLIKATYEKTKERLFNYFLAIIITLPFYFLIFFIPFLGILFIKFKVFSDWSVWKILVLGTSGIFITVVSIYVSAWTELLKIKVLINPEKISPFNALKEVRPLIKGFVILQIHSLLFHLWLIPIYLVTLFIAPLLWSFWSIFTSFVYLEKQKKGLANIWQSKAMIMQKPGAILLRILAVGLVIFLVEAIPSEKNNLLIIFKTVFGFVAYPFSTIFVYQIYKNLDEPQEVKPPYNWLISGGIGWLIFLLVALVIALILLLK